MNEFVYNPPVAHDAVIRSYEAKARALRARFRATAAGKSIEPAVRLARWLEGQAVKIVKDLYHAYENRRAIQELQAMPDWLLQDLGLTRAQIPVAVKGLYKPARATPVPVDGIDERSARVRITPEDTANDGTYEAAA